MVGPSPWRRQDRPLRPAAEGVAKDARTCRNSAAAAGGTAARRPRSRSSAAADRPLPSLDAAVSAAQHPRRSADDPRTSLPSPVAITTAVVPVAGLATRLRPLSRGVPKGLLPVAGRPVVQHVVDELEACGIERVVLVTGRGRSAFAAHFAGAAGPRWCASTSRGRSGSATRSCAPRPRSTGRSSSRWAMRCWAAARRRASCERLAAAVEAGAGAAVAVEEVAAQDTRATGSWRRPATAIRSRSAGVVEKPSPEAAPSRLAVAGRYAATPALLDALRDRRARRRRRGAARRRAQRAGRRRRACAWRPARSASTSAPSPATARPSSSSR